LATVTVNSFLEDTSVLVATAFLLVRGPLERLLANPLWSGLTFGLLGASEAVLPNDRFPYATHTLVVAFASTFIGWRAGAIAALVAWLAFAIQMPTSWLTVAVQLALCVAIPGLLPKPKQFKTIYDIVGISAAQTFAVFAAVQLSATQIDSVSFWTIPANTFGAVLLALVVRDARLRSDAERHRQETIEAKRIAAEAQFGALRARVHPHFLFNALGAIAALCKIAPDRAAKAAISLGGLMRTSLEADFHDALPLAKEMETVRAYAQIECERFGSRLKLEYDVACCDDVAVPPFSVQILVENAILHGVSRAPQGGCVSVVARRSKKYTFIAVADDGVGLPAEGWRRASPHGLNLLEAQIFALSSQAGRLRILPRSSGGTLAVMRLPLPKEIVK
jgi:hypothetical protein